MSLEALNLSVLHFYSVNTVESDYLQCELHEFEELLHLFSPGSSKVALTSVTSSCWSSPMTRTSWSCWGGPATSSTSTASARTRTRTLRSQSAASAPSHHISTESTMTLWIHSVMYRHCSACISCGRAKSLFSWFSLKTSFMMIFSIQLLFEHFFGWHHKSKPLEAN